MLDGDNGISHRQIAIVVGMNPQGSLEMLRRCYKSITNILGERSSIGVAKNDRICPRLFSRLERGQCVLSIGSKTIKEMLGIVNHFLAQGFQMSHRVADEQQVFLQRNPKGHLDVEIPTLPKDGDHRRVRFD